MSVSDASDRLSVEDREAIEAILSLALQGDIDAIRWVFDIVEEGAWTPANVAYFEHVSYDCRPDD